MVKIFVGNLAPGTSADDLRSLFSQYGKITECDVVKNFCFVHMNERAEADEAIRALHQYELNGQPLNVELSRGKSRGSTKLHVGNLACSNQELRAKFEEFGAVMECDIVKDYAFVHMERMEDAMEAISKMDNTAFKGKLMSVKLSTSRLRTAPGMGERSGCYRCGQDGHWSKECPLDSNGSRGGNGSEPKSNGYGASRFGGRGGRSRDYHPGYGGDLDFGDGYAPVHGYPRGYGRGAAGYESAMGYGAPPRYGMSAAAAAEHNMAQMYGGSSSAYGSSGSHYGAPVPAYPTAARRSSGEDRDPYGAVDFYEKYRAHPPYGAGYFEERHSHVPLPATSPHSSAAMMREPSGLDPYERHQHPLPPPPPPPPASLPPSYYAMRDRSPIRRVPAEADGYAFENSGRHPSLPPPPGPRGSAYDLPRNAYAERPRYAY